jgi:hypothetical protein
MSARHLGMQTDPADAAASYCNEIAIRADGRVVIKHLTPELLELALAIDPRDARLRRRAGLWLAPGGGHTCPTP